MSILNNGGHQLKLYSRGQVLFFAAAAAVVAAALVAGAFILWNGQAKPAAVSAAPSASTTAPEPMKDGFELQTTPVKAGDKLEFSEDYLPEEKQNISIYESLNEAVVNISTEVLSYNWFLEAVPQSGGTGSGAIIDKRGYVLTNNHVIADAVKVQITLADGTNFEGTIIGKDMENDLAVVKFDPKGKELTTIPLGTSTGLKVGQKVLAIGNPFALDRTLTTGIVSALGRPMKTENGLVRQMIQTDASINPGNSGGPLLNSKGQLIGINTMIYSPSGGSVGIGFAVPVDTARRVVPDLIQYGKVVRGWVDVVPVQLFPQLARYARLPVSKGLLISRVLENGNAKAAGIRGGDRDKGVRYGDSIIYLGGDVIIAVNNKPVETLADLYVALESTKPGDKVPITLLRGSSKLDLNITLSERPDKYQWE